ncbi:hypothetical protein [Leucobacter sp. M11]|uniref:hypothetical protein n=1 Tax=Leucobacter sp. M11 TaxID=2993565 RepID=UPI002D8079DA|nr:hypothetical protein [Leucobacter sp. M11]MEB4613574.1 hypothetical protein [Leucobacter sp. M11]
MNLKFTFNGPKQDHDHGAPQGRELPDSLKHLDFGAKSSGGAGSSDLWLRAAIAEDHVFVRAVSGDGVVYAKSRVSITADAPDAATPESWLLAVRSGASRALAEAGEHLASSIRGLYVLAELPVTELLADDRARALFPAIGVPAAALPAVPVPGAQLGVSDDAWQRRTGLPVGTPVFADTATPEDRPA